MPRILSKLAGLAIVTASLLGAALAPPAHAESALETVIKRGTLIVGTSLGTPPFGITNSAMQPDGFDVGVARLLARDLGVKLQIQDIVASARVPSITSGKVDIVISSFSVTAERARAIAFSNPIYIDQQVLMAPKDQPITSMAAMAGKRIGVTRSSTNDIVATKLAPKGTTIQRFDDDASTNQAMLAGQIDGMVTSLGLAKVMEARDPKLVVKFVVAQAPMSVGLKLDDPEWLHYINTALFMDWTNGDIQALQEKWFGAANASLPAF
jgi:polar amino acid transport system substrate-binding protein